MESTENMNAIGTTCIRPLRWLVPALLVLLLTSCATRPRIDWAARVGSYTFDQAVVELGPPDKQARLEDGTVVAEWLTQRAYSYTYPAMGYPWYSGPFYTPFYYAESGYSPNYFLRLVFGPDHKLQSWRKFTR